MKERRPQKRDNERHTLPSSPFFCSVFSNLTADRIFSFLLGLLVWFFCFFGVGKKGIFKFKNFRRKERSEIEKVEIEESVVLFS
jgi:hypothetical protein